MNATYTYCLLRTGLVALVALAVATPAQESLSTYETKAIALPAGVMECIVHDYPGYHVPTENDFILLKTPQIAEHYEKLKEEAGRFRTLAFHTPERPGLPFACAGDFNGDGTQDVALMLLSCSSAISESAADPTGLIIVFWNTVDGYTSTIAGSASDHGLIFGQYIETREPGRILTIKGRGYDVPADDPMPEFIELGYDSIIDGYEGKAASLLYWEDGVFKSISISD